MPSVSDFQTNVTVRSDGTLSVTVSAVQTNVTVQSIGAHNHDDRYLYKENTDAFTPDGDYEPATKKYVDDQLATTDTHAELTDMPSADNSDHDGRYYTETELGATASPSGASLIGVEDTDGNFTATDVEAALAEVKAQCDDHEQGEISHEDIDDYLIDYVDHRDSVGLRDDHTQYHNDARATTWIEGKTHGDLSASAMLHPAGVDKTFFVPMYDTVRPYVTPNSNFNINLAYAVKSGTKVYGSFLIPDDWLEGTEITIDYHFIPYNASPYTGNTKIVCGFTGYPFVATDAGASLLSALSTNIWYTGRKFSTTYDDVPCYNYANEKHEGIVVVDSNGQMNSVDIEAGSIIGVEVQHLPATTDDINCTTFYVTGFRVHYKSKGHS